MNKTPEKGVPVPTVEGPLEQEVTRIKGELIGLSIEIGRSQRVDELAGDRSYPTTRHLIVRWIEIYEGDYLPALVAARDPRALLFDANDTPLTPLYAEHLRALVADEIPEPKENLFDKAERLRRERAS